MVLTLFGYWMRGARVPRDWCTTCFCSFSPWAAHKSKFLTIILFDTVIISNDHPRYVKPVLGFISEFIIFFGYWLRGGGGGGSQGIGTQPASVVFQLGQLKNRSLWNLFFLIP